MEIWKKEFSEPVGKGYVLIIVDIMLVTEGNLKWTHGKINR